MTANQDTQITVTIRRGDATASASHVVLLGAVSDNQEQIKCVQGTATVLAAQAWSMIKRGEA